MVGLVGDVTAAVRSVEEEAQTLRASGLLGQYEEMMQACRELHAQRVDCLKPYQRNGPPVVFARVRAAGCLAAPSRSAGATPGAHDAAATAASALRTAHYAIVDGFLGCATCAAVSTLLREMRAAGELAPGEVAAGLQRATRGDLMRWVPLGADAAVPPALHALLAALDALVLALQPRLPELAGASLMRHEVQATCYPGDGARYTRHVDDAARRGRVLTCILYLNEAWTAAAGGALRLHLPGGARDVEPIADRLLLFWSDARCPHEVLPAHADRYAVSVWYNDGRAVSASAPK